MTKNFIFTLAIIPLLLILEGSAFLSSLPISQSADPVFVGAGDISACNHDRDEATAKLLDDIGGTVFTLGDNVYPDGTLSEYEDCYDPTWGRHKDRTHPSPGNHEYNTAGAAGYYEYFGAAASPLDANCISNCKGYYSYDLGTWHIIVLNSEISMSTGSDQETWLRADLAANPSTCTLAYWHKPLFSSGGEGEKTSTRPLWQALYDYDADVVLNGHNHMYERFAPQDPNREADPGRGIREFVVGTGGAGLSSIASIMENSEVADNTSWGVLKLTLHPTSYDWEFIPVPGKTFTDSGSANCVGISPTPTATDTATPSPTATKTSTPTSTATNTPTRTPTATMTLTPTSTSTMTPTPTSTATITPTPTPTHLIFKDNFESHNLSAWSSKRGDGGDLRVTRPAAWTGSFGLQAIIDDRNPIFAIDKSPAGESFYRARFYFDPNSIKMASGNNHFIFMGYKGNSMPVLRVQFRFWKGKYQLRVALRDDHSTWKNSKWVTIKDAYQLIRLTWQASAGPGKNNGRLRLWVNGALKANLNKVDNDTRRIDTVRLGAISGIDNSTRGRYYFDAFGSWR
jgi:hypothetical protein